MKEGEIRELKKGLDEIEAKESAEKERLEEIYSLCKAGLIPRPLRRFFRELCPREGCGKKLAWELTWKKGQAFYHYSCSCGYEWVKILTPGCG